jgi:diguanylate cyclase (GGDEF)-like protein
VTAELLFQRAGLDGNEGFTIGLLQDLGVVLLVLNNPSVAGPYSEMVRAAPLEQQAIERALFGETHAAVIDDWIRAFALPEDIGTAIRQHHSADATKRARLAGLAEVVAAVLATGAEAELRHAYQQLEGALGMAESEVDALIDDVGLRVAETAVELGFTVGDQPSVEQILRATNRSLVDMNGSYEELVLRLEETIRQNKILEAELRSANAEMQRLVSTDPLTGLANRRTFLSRLYDVLSAQARRGGHTTLLILDIDHFKRVNDTWGHGFGDEALVAVASALQRAVRAQDLAIRAGGEEFALLLPDTDVAGGRQLGERVLKAVRDLRLVAPSDQRVPITASLGVAVVSGRPAGRADIAQTGLDLYNAADEAMYAAKKGGRDGLRWKVTPIRWS